MWKFVIDYWSWILTPKSDKLSHETHAQWPYWKSSVAEWCIYYLNCIDGGPYHNTKFGSNEMYRTSRHSSTPFISNYWRWILTLCITITQSPSTLNTVTMSPWFNFFDHPIFWFLCCLTNDFFWAGGHGHCWKCLIEASPPYTPMFDFLKTMLSNKLRPKQNNKKKKRPFHSTNKITYRLS